MLMRKCRHFITANSTFNWWGAWLGEATDKIVISPRGTAKSMAATAKADGQMSVLVPLCVNEFVGTDGAVAKLKLTQYGHDDVVREEGR
jgi:hypothetical protein